MKDLHFPKTIENESSLVDQVMNSKPEFATREAAALAYTQKLEAHAKKCGRTVQEMLEKAESSPEFDEDCDEAMAIWTTLSALKRRK